jgi:UTP--glucose-1-phosphate uridylyltransferase
MSHAPTDLPVDAETSKILQRFGFDAATFRELCTRLKDGLAGPEANRVRGTVNAPAPGDVCDLPALGSPERERLATRGMQAIARGKVGVVILAGGMATRFGGVVKAAVEAVDGHTFLDLKLRDLERRAETTGGAIPVVLMTSFATEDEVARLAERAPRIPVKTFAQFVSLRVTPDGELFRENDGSFSPYAPGHGDLTFALRRAGFLRELRNAGVELLFMSNVDNLGATLDPAVIGFHLESGCAITAEVVDKEKGDKGGAPARVDGTLQIVEAFRFPEAFDQDSISVFNTNTFVLTAEPLERDFPLSWFAVRKEVEGRSAVQFERLVGELTAFLPSAFLRVPRGGTDGRFQPVKDPEELAQRRDEIRAILRARGIL